MYLYGVYIYHFGLPVSLITLTNVDFLIHLSRMTLLYDHTCASLQAAFIYEDQKQFPVSSFSFC